VTGALIACEESGRIRDAMLDRGIWAWSCDVVDGRGKYPAHHHRCDVRELFEGRIAHSMRLEGQGLTWDLMIAHPPCTYLCLSGALRLYLGGKKANGRDPDRWEKMEKAAQFFAWLWMRPVKRICIEQPRMHGYAQRRIEELIGAPLPRPQVIQPHWFGDDASKATCLYLRELPFLEPTEFVPGRIIEYNGKQVERWANQTDGGWNRLPPSEDRGALRAETYPGIAAAMAEQWGRRFLASTIGRPPV
jgi:hypothetical protein